MSDTPKAADDCMKLLDAGHHVLLFKNGLGSYTGLVLKAGQSPNEATEIDNQITDDFTPSQCLYRLTEKFFGRIA